MAELSPTWPRLARLGAAALRPGLLVGLAAALAPVLASGSYLEQPAAQEFASRMQTKHGFAAEQLESWLADAEKQQKIIDAISRPAEKTLDWQAYRRIFLTPERIAGGRAFIEQHQDVFARAESDPGLSRYFAAAILGVETRYGEHRGNYRVLDALATLAFDYPPRSSFFRKELEQFLLLTREQGFDPLALQGSYAGAMGYGQFIPSSYRAYAIDFDADGTADILDNPVDAIGSIANYFARHGWKPGQPVAEQVSVNASQRQLAEKALKPSKTLGAFRQAGIPVQSRLPDSAPARLLRLEGKAGPEYWLTYHNFYVITRYNHSSLYAMAVLQLAEEIQASAEVGLQRPAAAIDGASVAAIRENRL